MAKVIMVADNFLNLGSTNKDIQCVMIKQYSSNIAEVLSFPGAFRQIHPSYAGGCAIRGVAHLAYAVSFCSSRLLKSRDGAVEVDIANRTRTYDCGRVAG